MVIPAEFAELAILDWNRDPARPMAADEAFALCESNWRHVDADRLTPREAYLIALLKQEFGRGHFLKA